MKTILATEINVILWIFTIWFFVVHIYGYVFYKESCFGIICHVKLGGFIVSMNFHWFVANKKFALSFLVKTQKVTISVVMDDDLKICKYSLQILVFDRVMVWVVGRFKSLGFWLFRTFSNVVVTQTGEAIKTVPSRTGRSKDALLHNNEAGAS